MDKQQALVELKELQERAAALEAIIKAPDTPEVFAGVQVVTASKKGYYIDVDGRVHQSSASNFNAANSVSSGQLFPTADSAKKAAKLAELQVRLYKAMAKSWGGSRVPWEVDSSVKYVVVSSSTGDKFRRDTCYKLFSPIAFRTLEDLNAFIESATPDGITFLLRGMQYEGPTLW